MGQRPTPGHPIPRGGKPYLWVTWLAKLLGGNQCLWSAWFKSRFMHAKFEEQAAQLAEWNRDHSRLMREVRQELEENGWRVAVESENAFKLPGVTAVVVGKPDIVATMPGHVLIVDGKTGRERDADWWQVLLYLFAFPYCRRDLVGDLRGSIRYQRGNKDVPVLLRELTEECRGDIVGLIKVVSAAEPPAKAPSREECKRCNIGIADCPERVSEQAATMVSGF